MKQRGQRVVAGLAVVAVLCAGNVASAHVTPFGEQAHEATERGLAWLRGQEQAGSIGGPATGLALLAFMEKRASVDWGSPSVGYLGMSEADRALVERGARWLVDNTPGLNVGGAEAYPTGTALMALALYLASGGPEEVGARVPVPDALAAGVRALKGAQADGGGWCHGAPECEDMLATLFAASGLGAAAAVLDGADDTVPRAGTFVERAAHPEGGFGDRPNSDGASHASTASALRILRLARRETSAAGPQAALRWLEEHYSYEPPLDGDEDAFYFYLWAASDGLEVSTAPEPPEPGVVYADNIGGRRDPAADGFPEEPRDWYYDFAFQLLRLQADDGHWPPARVDGEEGLGPHADTAFALLTLERSLGSCCFDTDGDGLSDMQDNCPQDPNPEQDDRDDDGVGDLCDNCPDTQNRDQADEDGDGFGDACEPHVDPCFPEDCIERCDGMDNDMDGQIDEPNEGDPPMCPQGHVCRDGSCVEEGGEGEGEGEGEGGSESDGGCRLGPPGTARRPLASTVELLKASLLRR